MSNSTLGIDPASLNLTFKGEWIQFKDTSVSKVLILFFETRLAGKRVELENVTAEKLASVQGAIQELKTAIRLLRKDFLESDLDNVKKYIEENYGK